MKTKIEGYEKYSVSDAGQIFKGDRELRTQNTHGYRSIGLCNDKGKVTRLIHRLVAKAFIPNPNGLLQVNHLNGIKSDNRVENLEWTDHSGNMTHAMRTGLWKTQRVFVFAMNGDLLSEFPSVAEAGRKLRIPANRISLVLTSERRNSTGWFRFSRTLKLEQPPPLKSRKRHTKLKGVFWDREREQWTAYLYHNRKQINLGRFDTDKEAHMAYLIGYKRFKAESI